MTTFGGTFHFMNGVGVSVAEWYRTQTPKQLMQLVLQEIRQMRIDADRKIYREEMNIRMAEESRQYAICEQIRKLYKEGADRKKQKRKAHYFLHRATECVLCDDDSAIDYISLETLKKGTRLAKIRACGHTFAQVGLKEWIGINPSCPVCRCSLT